MVHDELSPCTVPPASSYEFGLSVKVPGMSSYVSVAGRSVAFDFDSSHSITKSWASLRSALDHQLRSRGLKRIVTKAGDSKTSVYTGAGYACNVFAYDSATLACTTSAKAAKATGHIKPLLAAYHKKYKHEFSREIVVVAIVTKNPNDKRYYYEELVIQKLGSPNSDQSLIAYFYKTPGHSLRYGWAGKKTPTCDALTKSTAMSKAFFGAPCTIGTNTYFVGMGE